MTQYNPKLKTTHLKPGYQVSFGLKFNLQADLFLTKCCCFHKFIHYKMFKFIKKYIILSD